MFLKNLVISKQARCCRRPVKPIKSSSPVVREVKAPKTCCCNLPVQNPPHCWQAPKNLLMASILVFVGSRWRKSLAFCRFGRRVFWCESKNEELAGLILVLHQSPIYFQKKGRGRYKAAPEENLKAALAGIERKKQQALVQAAYVDELKQYRLPEALPASVCSSCSSQIKHISTKPWSKLAPNCRPHQQS